MQYEIRVEGHLGERWSAWFDGLDTYSEHDGTTVIRGSIVDQAALHGLLQRLRDIGIPLISVTPVGVPTPSAPGAPTKGTEHGHHPHHPHHPQRQHRSDP